MVQIPQGVGEIRVDKGANPTLAPRGVPRLDRDSLNPKPSTLNPRPYILGLQDFATLR